jgi:antitoxin component YwqK of YwqJK toxin-antitoxin module
MEYYRNGNIEHEQYYVNDKLHRIDGSAILFYNINGKIERGAYYVNGNLRKNIRY